ncbi:MAG TPA: DUF4173 domain-containing protein [Vitreimonas sp.]|nr:DUF4173 domain-containing protein [Vitreimonas sp.]
MTAARVFAVALAVGLAAELLLDGHAVGLNVVLAVAVLLTSMATIAGGVRRLDPMDAWIPVTALVLAGFVALRDDGPLVFVDIVGALGLCAASAPALAGQSVTRRSTGAMVDLAARVMTAILTGGLPLLGRVRAESDAGSLAARASRLAPVARGLLLGAPLLIVFAALFAAADPIFRHTLDSLFSVDPHFGELPARAVFTAVATWLVGGLLWFIWVARPPLVPQSLGAAATEARPVPLFRIGAVEALTVLVVLDLLFAVFVALQLAYLFGGLDTLAAIGMTYADYARRGFFELVAVVVLVGGLLLGLEAVVAHRSRPYVGGALVLVALTAVVLASSYLRLALYQEAYGWTELRFYVLAAIVFLALDLAAAAVLIFRNRSRWLPHAIAASSLVVLVGVNLVGPQATITERNLERALVPSVVPDYGRRVFDATYLGSLDADAVPAMVEALPALPEAERVRLTVTLRDAHRRFVILDDRTWQATNLSRERARAALEELFGP